MSCWDGFGPPDRDEDADGWQDSDGVDLPWEPPRCVHDPEHWKPHDWTGTPEERMWRELMDDEDEEC